MSLLTSLARRAPPTALQTAYQDLAPEGTPATHGLQHFLFAEAGRALCGGGRSGGGGSDGGDVDGGGGGPGAAASSSAGGVGSGDVGPGRAQHAFADEAVQALLRMALASTEWNAVIGALLLTSLQRTARFVASLRTAAETPTSAGPGARSAVGGGGGKHGGLLYADVADALSESGVGTCAPRDGMGVHLPR
jgi:hypothetical protein